MTRDPLAPLIAKFERLAALDDTDRAAIRSLPLRVSAAPVGHYLVREGATAEECCILLTGYACRHKLTSGGARQIVSFHIPGDALDFQHLLLPRADHNVQTITAAQISWVPTRALRALAAERSRVSDAIWRDTLIEASIFREWVLNVGRRDARSRVAHMLCEFAVRRERAGLGAADRFELPMTQEQIGDATGLTPVHVNRTLQALGSEGVIHRDRRHISIADWKRLQAVADFDPAYLHAAA